MVLRNIVKSQLARLFRAFDPKKPLHPPDKDPLFHYTSGRWLWNEDEQLKARFRPFNVPGLKEAACQAAGTEQCMSCEKIGEGNYNKAYRLVMGDDQKVIAKIPHPNAGPSTLTTASEVATMEFARTILNLPVPKVLAWSASDQNHVQTEYIIMEEARGSQLYESWQDISLETKYEIIRQIVDIERKLLSFSFNKHGPLYLRDSGIPGCEPAIVTNASHEVSDHISSRFSIGPTVQREFWEKERSTMHQHQGPWRSAIEYLQSIARREIDWLEAFADPQEHTDFRWQFTTSEQKSPEAHIALLQKFLSAIPHIVPKDAGLVSPRLWHPDFHAGNVYIDDQARISCLIDWQGTWATPVFIGARPPLLLDYGVDMLMELPANFEELDETTKNRLEYQVSQSNLIHYYETLTAKTNPLMHKMMRHTHGQTLKWLKAFVGTSWDDNGLYQLRECLIKVERKWDHFHVEEPCPYHFPEKEIRRHREEADAFNENQELWQSLRGVLMDDGYTLNETFSEAVEALNRLQESRSAGK